MISVVGGDAQKQQMKQLSDLTTWLSSVSAVVIVTLGVTHVERPATHAQSPYRSYLACVRPLRGGLLTLSMLIFS
jgi:hypothetical protein